MISDEILIGLLFLLRRRRRRRRRSLWVRPVASSSEGHFQVMMEGLDEASFASHFGMSRSSFGRLLRELEAHIRREDTVMRRSIPSRERLAMALRYLRTGCSYTDLRRHFSCGVSTAHQIVSDVCHSLLCHLKDSSRRTHKDWLRISEGFESRADFPNCLGALGGKTIRLAQGGSPMALMAVCDANYRFSLIDVSDGHSSRIFRKMREDAISLPDRALWAAGRPLPYVFLGDRDSSGQYAHVGGQDPPAHVLGPFTPDNLSEREKIFNYRLARTRRYLDCSFGVLTNKWQILQRPLNSNAQTIVEACCLLHNFVIDGDGVQFEDTLNVIGLEDAVMAAGDPKLDSDVRDGFADYFVSEEGSVPWQLRMINN